MYLVTPDERNYLRVHNKEMAERLAENLGGIITTIRPKNILVSKRNGNQTAIFDRLKGTHYAIANNLEYTSEYNKIFTGKFYTVVSGEVVIPISHTEFPEVKRIYEN